MTDGAQRQRTGLAWQRTALGAAGCTLLLAHAAGKQDWGIGLLPVVFGAITTVMLSGAGRRRERALRADNPTTPINRSTIKVTAVMVVMTVVSALPLLR
ncbi:DUF202 domain-containing protein [Amycolatopsis nigrescens]|uniref:DUF202 domain-containing protein n=1 Tax=Amycolatopsis nigrescens TaxID=381445 RepID=UPI000362242F|nr:DUF202 domain-containing protein [Amycolatopsis nigrescens]